MSKCIRECPRAGPVYCKGCPDYDRKDDEEENQGFFMQNGRFGRIKMK